MDRQRRVYLPYGLYWPHSLLDCIASSEISQISPQYSGISNDINFLMVRVNMEEIESMWDSITIDDDKEITRVSKGATKNKTCVSNNDDEKHNKSRVSKFRAVEPFAHFIEAPQFPTATTSSFCCRYCREKCTNNHHRNPPQQQQPMLTQCLTSTLPVVNTVTFKANLTGLLHITLCFENNAGEVVSLTKLQAIIVVEMFLRQPVSPQFLQLLQHPLDSVAASPLISASSVVSPPQALPSMRIGNFLGAKIVFECLQKMQNDDYPDNKGDFTLQTSKVVAKRDHRRRQFCSDDTGETISWTDYSGHIGVGGVAEVVSGENSSFDFASMSLVESFRRHVQVQQFQWENLVARSHDFEEKQQQQQEEEERRLNLNKESTSSSSSSFLEPSLIPTKRNRTPFENPRARSFPKRLRMRLRRRIKASQPPHDQNQHPSPNDVIMQSEISSPMDLTFRSISQRQRKGQTAILVDLIEPSRFSLSDAGQHLNQSNLHGIKHINVGRNGSITVTRMVKTKESSLSSSSSITSDGGGGGGGASNFTIDQMSSLTIAEGAAIIYGTPDAIKDFSRPSTSRFDDAAAAYNRTPTVVPLQYYSEDDEQHSNRHINGVDIGDSIIYPLESENSMDGDVLIYTTTTSPSSSSLSSSSSLLHRHQHEGEEEEEVVVGEEKQQHHNHSLLLCDDAPFELTTTDAFDILVDQQALQSIRDDDSGVLNTSSLIFRKCEENDEQTDSYMPSTLLSV